jgi:hypothetical protein
VLTADGAGEGPAPAGDEAGGDSSCANENEQKKQNVAKNLILIAEITFIAPLSGVGQALAVAMLPKNSVAALSERRHI